MPRETFSEQNLVLEYDDEGEDVRITWKGQSTASEPEQLVTPVMEKGLDRALRLGLPLVIDFTEVSYINSAAVVPIIRLLRKAQKKKHPIEIIYRKDLKWQELSFSAMAVVHKDDETVKITGVE